MLSMPPATTTSAEPARKRSVATIAAFMPEPHILLTVVQPAPSGRPAPSEAWRAGACPWPAGRTQPIRTSSTLSAATPARTTAADTARAPSAGAVTSLKSPRNPPMGVRAAPTMTMASPAFMGIVSSRPLFQLSRAGGPRVNSTVMSLSSEEVERYARQIVLRGVGGPGQNRLKAARVLVVGAGGLGSPALQYLAGAGVGTLGIADDDVVALSNLHRQIIHATGDVGRPKTESAAEAISRINPHVAVEPIALRVDAGNARGLVSRFDVVLDGSDNFATRYALSDACYFERRPLVTAALGEFDGTLTTLKPFETGPDGRPNPTYRCLFPVPPDPGTVPTCAEAGVLGALGGVLGSLMALEAIREIVAGFGEGDAGLVGRLLMIDARAMRFETLRYGWDETNPLSGTNNATGRPASALL